MPPQFGLTIHGDDAVSSFLDQSIEGHAEVAFGELQLCGFQLQGRETEEYRVRVGDIFISARSLYAGKQVIWEDGAYLESASGVTQIQLESRVLGSSQPRIRRTLMRELGGAKAGITVGQTRGAPASAAP